MYFVSQQFCQTSSTFQTPQLKDVGHVYEFHLKIWVCRKTTPKPIDQSSSIIINHHQSSSIIINHHQSSSIIINHHQSSSIIMIPIKMPIWAGTFSMFIYLVDSTKVTKAIDKELSSAHLRLLGHCITNPGLASS